MIGYLISDHAMELAKQIAGMLGIDPQTEKQQFLRLVEVVKAELLRYETKADRQNRRVNPCS